MSDSDPDSDPTRDPSHDESHTSGSEQITRTSHTPAPEEGRIGHYRILEQVGTGGMGEVYRAEQTEPIRRTVALKVIKRGMDTKEVVTRFEAERQALALMDHPNIAKVFEAGSTPRGRPYFVMEYVQGEPINTYCDKQKLTARKRLDLFMQLCEGVQHAHQKAIIHRDLKPSNVLVTIQNDVPIPKIIDFGVAKATAQKLTEKTMHTALGELIGTPEYMSPEQAEMTGANVDTRTDVYALGVILYELLAGTLPFEAAELRKAGFAGIVQMIREQDPMLPSTKVSTLGKRATEVADARRTVPDRLRGALRGDLDWITMKALEKDRTRRYGSAADLASDVRRHLRHEPVLASPPGAGYRARKFIRRHRIGVSAGLAAALVIVSFAVTMTVQAKRIAVQRDRANAEADAARKVTEFLVSSFEVADPREARDEEVTARQILERGALKIDRELQDQPLLRAQMMDAIGRVYQNLGRYDRAEEMLQGALDLRRAELGEWHVDVAKSMSTLGWLRYWELRYDEGRAQVKQALTIQEDLLGLDHVDTGWSTYYLGALESGSGNVELSREFLEKARAIFERQLGPDALGVSWCWADLGVGYMIVEDYTKALECHKRALEIKARVLPEAHADIAISAGAVGWALIEIGDFLEAIPYLERAVQVFTKTLGHDHVETAGAMHNLGLALRENKRFAEAREYLERALPTIGHAFGEESPSAASVIYDLGLVAHRTGQLAEAESLYADALPKLQRAFEPDKQDLFGAYFNRRYALLLEHYGALLRELSRVAEADILETRAKEIREKLAQSVD